MEIRLFENLIKKSHTEAVNKLKYLKKDGIINILMENYEERLFKKEKITVQQQIIIQWILFKSVILAIKINGSINFILVVQKKKTCMEKFINYLKIGEAKIMHLNLLNV